MEDKYIIRLSLYSDMIDEFKTTDGWVSFNNGDDWMLVDDLQNIIGEVSSGGIKNDYQREILNRLEKLYQESYK